MENLIGNVPAGQSGIHFQLVPVVPHVKKFGTKPNAPQVVVAAIN